MQNFKYSNKLKLDLPNSNQLKNLKIIIGIVVLMCILVGGWFYLQSYKQKVYQREITDLDKPMESVKGAYDQILQTTEKSAYDLTVEGVNLVGKGKTELGVMALETATQKDQNYRDAFLFTGYTHLKLAEEFHDRARLEKAKFFLVKAKDLDPIYALTYQLLAKTYQQLGDAENAELCYNKAKDFEIK